MTNEIASLRDMVNQQKDLITDMKLTMRGILAQPSCKCTSRCNIQTPETKSESAMPQNLPPKTARNKQHNRPTSNRGNESTQTQRNQNRVDKNTLIIGDLIIRDIKDRGLKNTEVKCIRGRINHIKDSIVAEVSCSSFETVVLHVGTNNCHSDESFSNSIHQYEDLVSHIKTESPTTDIIISTVCPRVDDQRSQNRVNALNNGLKQIAKTHQCKVIDNDETFLLRNGSVVQSNLNRGGLHLSWTGTRLLLRNIESVHQVLKNPLRNGTTTGYKTRSDGRKTVQCNERQT
ncbi:uncharacterized protein LOC117099995 [Anneissia japonica]|uniref:uncharacterized protein LOC117099995 n=1 Tax=Anneissia japonica TaxID=1529436 RepID=UPI0014256E3C|nr:uncharacterized protein LOC117099995 [Anneissia japonica]